MTALRQWSFTRVLLTSGAWFLLTMILFIAYQVRSFLDVSEGGGVGAVWVDINPLVLAIPVVPPLILTIVWWVVRRRA